MLLSYFYSLRNFNKAIFRSLCCFSSVLCFHFLLAFKNGSGTRGWKRTLSLSLSAFNRVARSSSEKKTFWKIKISAENDVVIYLWLNPLLIKRLQWHLAEIPQNVQKVSFWQTPAEHTRCFVWQVRAKIIELISPEKITYEFEPEVWSFSKIAKTWNMSPRLSEHSCSKHLEKKDTFVIAPKLT